MSLAWHGMGPAARETDAPLLGAVPPARPSAAAAGICPVRAAQSVSTVIGAGSVRPSMTQAADIAPAVEAAQGVEVDGVDARRKAGGTSASIAAFCPMTSRSGPRRCAAARRRAGRT